MTAFSQPERRALERLQIPKPESHPDADLLTAFAEHSLTARENEQVLAHLATCSDCRDTVALAGSQLVEPVPEPARKRGIWEMPLFHWGAVAATAVVVVFAVSLGLNRKVAPPQSSKAVFNEQLPASQADKVLAEPQNKPDANLDRQAAPATTTKRAVHLQEQVRYEKLPNPQESKEKGQSPATAAAGAPLVAKTAPPPPPPSPVLGGPVARDTNTALASKDGRTDLKQAPAAKKAEQQNAPSSTSANAYMADETLSVTTQSPAVSQMNSGGVTPSNEAEATTSMMAKRAPESVRAKVKNDKALFHEISPIKSSTTGTEWQITNEGMLQRSYNFGGTWENMMPDRQFRAVAVVRDHVWAGGDNGALYFSSDNGRNWSPMPVRSTTGDASGSIIRLRFDDLQNGSLNTSTGETWKTNDGGQTWHKE